MSAAAIGLSLRDVANRWSPTASWWAWMDQAACRGSDTADFYGSPTAMARARTRCAACPVSEICLWWAVVAESDLGYRFGIWAGTAPAQRDRIAQVTGVAYARSRFVSVAMSWNARRPAPTAAVA